jgi:hypothetical protein
MICFVYITMGMSNPAITNGPNDWRLDKITSQELYIKFGYIL